MITLDFETFYSSEYSLGLKAYNTTSYIRDPQFLIHGVGIKIDDKPSYYVSGHDEVIAHLQTLDWSQPVLCHNAYFDGFILTHHCRIKPTFYYDTMCMARIALGHHISHSLNNVADTLGFGIKLDGLAAVKNFRKLTPELDKILGEYCIRDVDLTYACYWEMLEAVPEPELELINLTIKMFTEPELKLDEQLVRKALEEEIANKKEKKKAANAITEELTSNEKFASKLRELGVEPPQKISPTTDKTTYAFAKTDKGFKKLLNSSNEQVRSLAEARIAVKSTLQETRATRLLDEGKNGQSVPVFLNYSGAHTHRWSGGNKLNLQNLPRGGTLRQALLAPAGHQILVCDLSQIEARITAWFCGQKDVVQAFANNEDVYKNMASKIYNIPPDKINKDQRFIGKVCVLGLGFGMGPAKLKDTLAMGFMGKPVEMSLEEVQNIVQKYRIANPNVVFMWQKLNACISWMMTNVDQFSPYKLHPVSFYNNKILLPNDTYLRYPNLRQGEDNIVYDTKMGETYTWGGKLLENIVQALARIVVAEQMLKISKHMKVVSMTHDEIIAIAKTEEAQNKFDLMCDIMTTPPVWATDLPLAAEGSFHERYSK